MCGIVGFTGLQIPDPERMALLKAMTELLKHRGPDDGGQELIGEVALGHRRLTIIDLSDAGHQPMSTPDGQVWMVYNGEFYDYRRARDELVNDGIRFESASDTEVSLHLYLKYGLRFIDRIDGMFALAIYDRRHDRLILARDRIGIKPLYYYENDGIFAFASEIKALSVIPGFDTLVDPDSLAQYLSFSYIQAPRTVFRKLRQLSPGHMLIREKGRVRVDRYWQPCEVDVPDSEEACVERFDELFSQAVRRRLVADVEVGSFLSGGIQSASPA